MKWFKWDSLSTLAVAMLATAVGFVIVAAVYAHDRIPEPVVDYYKNSVWLVSGIGKYGTTFHVSPTFLITNKHVVDGMKTAVISRSNSTIRAEVEVVAVSEVYDLALLHCAACVDMNPVIPIIEDHWFELGEVSYGGGYANALLGIHQGHLQSFNYRNTRMVTNSHMAPGDSGGPEIVVEEDGQIRLAGVRSAVRQLESGLLVFHHGSLEPAGGVRGFLRRMEVPGYD